jgi:hypothetical protein
MTFFNEGGADLVSETPKPFDDVVLNFRQILTGFSAV